MYHRAGLASHPTGYGWVEQPHEQNVSAAHTEIVAYYIIANKSRIAFALIVMLSLICLPLDDAKAMDILQYIA